MNKMFQPHYSENPEKRYLMERFIPYGHPTSEYSDSNHSAEWKAWESKMSDEVSQLKKYRASWLTKEHTEPMELGKDFELQYQESYLSENFITWYDVKKPKDDSFESTSIVKRRIVAIPIPAAAVEDSSANYMQVIPNSHSWDDFEMLLRNLEGTKASGKNVDIDYLIIGLKNSIARASTTPQQESKGEQDDLALEAMDFYWRALTEKLQQKDLGDIERRNYEAITVKLYKRITNPAPKGVDEVERLKGIIAGMQEGSESWKAEYDNCREILQLLVDLKREKDTNGKTEWYEKNQPLAWKKAMEFLEKYQHQ